MLLAQSQFTPPPDVLVVLGGIGFLMWILLLGSKLLDRFKGRDPQPPNQQLQMTQKDLERRVSLVEGAVNGVRAEMKEDRTKAEETARVRSAGIYSEIGKLRHEMGSEFKNIERALGRIEGKQDQ